MPLTDQQQSHGLIQVLQQRLLDQQQIDEALEQAKRYQQSLLQYLVNEQIIDPTRIAQACAKYFGFDSINLNQYDYRRLPTEYVTEQQLQQYVVLPLEKNQQQLTIAISDPMYLNLIEGIKFKTRLNIKTVFVPYDQLITLIHKIISEAFYATLFKKNSTTIDETTVVTLI